MAESSFASLNPTLLARKGGAKPAMRPQSGLMAGMALDGSAAENLEDLGWNDMGPTPGNVAEEAPAPVAQPAPETEAEIIHITPAAANEGGETAKAPATQPVRRQQDQIAKRIGAATRQPAAKAKRAAFTLRLDAERHLRLRLASTVQGRSAQTIVTEALDALMAKMPELEDLATKVERT